MKKFLLGNNKHIEKSSFFWNMCASIMYSAQSAILLLVVTRVAGLYEAGVFSVAYTLTYMFTNIGNYNMRSYQVSDAKREYSFNDYYSSRIITIILMFAFCLGDALLNRYTGEKIWVVFFFCIYRMTESLEDVYHGEIQKIGRLDVVSKMLTLRITISTIFFIVTCIVFKNLALASFVLMLSTILIYGIFNTFLFKEFKIQRKFLFSHVWKLLFVCFPVFIGAFLYSYLINAPKYAIDRILTSDMQTIFNIIFMPIMIINMLSILVFKPTIARMGELWTQGNKKAFIKDALKQFTFIVIITGVIVLAGYIAGIPVLAFIYGVNLDEYKMLFIVLLIFGGISAINNYLSVVITVMRKQMYIMIGYGVALVVNYMLLDNAVRNYALQGAGYVYGIVMTVIFVIFFAGIMFGVRKKKERFK